MNAVLPRADEPEPCVEADAVARLLLVSKDTVRRYTLTEGLPFIALPGGRKRYLLSQVAAWRDARTTRQCKRIVAAHVPAIFKKHDLRPISGEYGSQVRNCGCLLVALLIDAGQKAEAYQATSVPNGIAALAGQVLGLDRDYAHGLMNGWDRVIPQPSGPPHLFTAYDIGLIDGRDAFVAVAESFPIFI